MYQDDISADIFNGFYTDNFKKNYSEITEKYLYKVTF